MIARSDAGKQVGAHVGGWKSKEKLPLAATACSEYKSLGACESAPRARGDFSSLPVCWWLSCLVRLEQSYLAAA